MHGQLKSLFCTLTLGITSLTIRASIDLCQWVSANITFIMEVAWSIMVTKIVLWPLCKFLPSQLKGFHHAPLIYLWSTVCWFLETFRCILAQCWQSHGQKTRNIKWLHAHAFCPAREHVCSLQLKHPLIRRKLFIVYVVLANIHVHVHCRCC